MALIKTAAEYEKILVDAAFKAREKMRHRIAPSNRWAFDKRFFRQVLQDRPLDIYPEGPSFVTNCAEVQETVCQQEADTVIEQVRGHQMRAGTAIMKPGLHKRYGVWSLCQGLWNPIIFIDPTTPVSGGFNALVAHETVHARDKHRLKQIVCLCIPVLGWVLYPMMAARHEVLADSVALDLFGRQEFMAFLHMHKEPTTWWGRWKYGSTREVRYERADECVRASKGERV